jgi:hypothetical protein
MGAREVVRLRAAAGPGREYDAVKRRQRYLSAHPGETIERDDAQVAPLWRHKDASGQEKASALDLTRLMDKLERPSS